MKLNLHVVVINKLILLINFNISIVKHLHVTKHGKKPIIYYFIEV